MHTYKNINDIILVNLILKLMVKIISILIILGTLKNRISTYTKKFIFTSKQAVLQ